MSRSLNIAVVCLCFFFAWCLISLCKVTGQPDSSLLLTDLVLYALWCILVAVSENVRKVSVAAILILALLQSFLVFFQFFDILESRHTLFKVTGFMKNPGLMGGFQAVAVIMLLHYVKQSKDFKARVWLMITCGVYLLSLLLSDSRAAFVGCIAGLIAAFWRESVNVMRKRRWILVAVLLAVISILAGLYWYRPASADARLLIWRVSWDMFLDSPLWGHGLSMFSHKYMAYQAEFFVSHPDSYFGYVAENVAYPYNDCLRIALELGVIGLGLLLVMLWQSLHVGTAGSLKAPLLTWVVFSFFSYPSYDAVMSACLPVVLFFPFQSECLTDKTRKWVSWGLSIGTLIVFCLSGYRHLSLERRLFTDEEKDWRKELYDMDGWYLIPKYNVVLSVLCESDPALTSTLFSYLKPTCENCCLMGDCLFNERNIDAAEKYYIRAGTMIPSRMTPLHRLWKLYLYEGRDIEAKKVAEKILNMDVKAEGTKTIRMRNEVKKYLNENI